MSEPLTIAAPPDDYRPAAHPRTVTHTSDVDKAPCPDCGKLFTVNADGSLRSHKCQGYIDVATSTGTPGTAGKRTSRVSRGRKQAPAKVRHLGSALIASGAEWSASQVFARAVPCRPDQVPADLPSEKDGPNADTMIGPFLDLLWPQIPAGGQKLLTNLAEQEDLLVAIFAWLEWFKTLRQWADEMSAEQAATRRSTQTATPGNLSVVPPTTPENPYVTFAPPTPEQGQYSGYEPFTPADPASATVS